MPRAKRQLKQVINQLYVGSVFILPFFEGMVFNVHVGLSNLKKPGAVDEADKAYALFIGDTVVVQEASQCCF